MKRSIFILIIFFAMAVFLSLGPYAGAYPTYQSSDGAVDNCSECHPGFVGGFGSSLHELHVGSTRMTATCTLCHDSPGSTPVYTSTSPTQNNNLGCAGCHEQFGLRLHHENAGAPADSSGLTCFDCHTVDPPPPAENIVDASVRAYYLRSDVNVKEPCNSDGSEDWDGDTIGLDNDGDLLYDGNDPDCQAGPTTVPVPSGQQIFPPFDAPNLPNPNVDPSLSQPIGVGTIATGGDTVDLRVFTDTFSGPVDVYFGINAPAISPEVFLLTSDGSLLPASQGLVKWKESVLSVNEDVFVNIPASALPPGTYNLALVVTPANSLNSFYFWLTSFTIGEQITVTMSGDQEVPPVMTAGTGTANIAVNFETGVMVGMVTFSGLSGPATLAHIHEAPIGENGNVVIGLEPPAAPSGVIIVSATLSSQLLDALMNNELYFNIHTMLNQGGEIRGQIIYPGPIMP